jgi:CARDB
MHRRLITGGLAAAAALAAAVPAQATPVPLTFDHVVIDTPATPYMEAVSPTTQPLKVTADVDPATGAFTVQPADFDFPEYSFSAPVPGKIDITLPAAATGTVDFTNGKLSLVGTFDTKISIEGIGDCTKALNLAMNTETTKPIQGSPFPAGATGPVTGNGAFGAGWDTLPAGTGAGCSVIDPVVQGAGGIWISRGIDPKPYLIPPGGGKSAKLALSAKKPKSVKAGKKAMVKAIVSNSGDGDAAGVEVCLTAPKPLTPKRKCKTVGALAAGASKNLTFKVNTKKHEKGKYALKLKATGSGLTAAAAKTTLKVTK